MRVRGLVRVGLAYWEPTPSTKIVSTPDLGIRIILSNSRPKHLVREVELIQVGNLNPKIINPRLDIIFIRKNPAIMTGITSKIIAT